MFLELMRPRGQSVHTACVIYWNMYPGWLPLLGGQSVPEGSQGRSWIVFNVQALMRGSV